MHYTREQLLEELVCGPDELQERLDDLRPLLVRERFHDAETGEVFSDHALALLRLTRSQRIEVLQRRIDTLQRVVTIKQEVLDQTLQDSIAASRAAADRELLLTTELQICRSELASRGKEQERSGETLPQLPRGFALEAAAAVVLSMQN